MKSIVKLVNSKMKAEVKVYKLNLGWNTAAIFSIYFHCTLSKTLVCFCFSGNTKTKCCITFIMRLYLPPILPPFLFLSTHSLLFFVAFFCEFEKIFACIHRSGVGCVCEICKCRTHNGLWNQFQFPDPTPHSLSPSPPPSTANANAKATFEWKILKVVKRFARQIQLTRLTTTPRSPIPDSRVPCFPCLS